MSRPCPSAPTGTVSDSYRKRRAPVIARGRTQCAVAVPQPDTIGRASRCQVWRRNAAATKAAAQPLLAGSALATKRRPLAQAASSDRSTVPRQNAWRQRMIEPERVHRCSRTHPLGQRAHWASTRRPLLLRRPVAVRWCCPSRDGGWGVRRNLPTDSRFEGGGGSEGIVPSCRPSVRPSPVNDFDSLRDEPPNPLLYSRDRRSPVFRS